MLHTEDTQRSSVHLSLMSAWQATEVVTMRKRGPQSLKKGAHRIKETANKGRDDGEQCMNSCGVEAPACPADAGGKYFWLCTGKSPAVFISHVSCASRPGLHHACIPVKRVILCMLASRYLHILKGYAGTAQARHFPLGGH